MTCASFGVVWVGSRTVAGRFSQSVRDTSGAKPAVDRPNTNSKLPGDCCHGEALVPESNKFRGVGLD